MIYTYEYPRPMVAADILVLNYQNNQSLVLLIRRRNQPFRDSWALPGGFVEENESLFDAAIRELYEETGLKDLELEQFYTFGDAGRDPRGHCVSVVFSAYVTENTVRIKAGDDAKDAKWFDLNSLPPLAFDHKKIIDQFLQKEAKKNCHNS